MTKQAESPDKEYCTRCDGEITADELAKGWPIPLDDDDYTCPSCYGDEAFCANGHVLSGTTDSDLCAECTTDATQTAPVQAPMPDCNRCGYPMHPDRHQEHDGHCVECRRHKGKSAMITLTGHEAIEFAQRHDLLLSKFTDPTDGDTRPWPLTIEEAERIAEEDPDLVFLDVTENPVAGDGQRSHEVPMLPMLSVLIHDNAHEGTLVTKMSDDGPFVFASLDGNGVELRERCVLVALADPEVSDETGEELSNWECWVPDGCAIGVDLDVAGIMLVGCDFDDEVDPRLGDVLWDSAE